MLEIDITSLVQEWIDGVPNYGFLLYSIGPNHILRYSSKETAVESEHPRLAITFLNPSPLALFSPIEPSSSDPGLKAGFAELPINTPIMKFR